VVKDPGSREGGKQRLGDLLRRRARSHGSPVPRRTGPAPRESTICERCGSVYRHKTWRLASVRPGLGRSGQGPWSICAACGQVEKGRYRGRVLLRPGRAAAEEDAIRRRIANVAARARFTQPERRVVSVRRDREGLEVLTTSEKLAHRMARELEKAFGGSASYAWSDRGRNLLATWRGDAPQARPGRFPSEPRRTR
jgi:hypothetical protein